MLISRPERSSKRLFGDGGGDPNPGGLEAVSSLSVHSQGLLHVGHQEDVYWCPTILYILGLCFRRWIVSAANQSPTKRAGRGHVRYREKLSSIERINA